jgi:zinc protease
MSHPVPSPARLLAVVLVLGVTRPAQAQQSLLERVVHRTALDNGLQVIVVDNPTVSLATVLVAVHNGAFTQDSAEEGLAHLYEHLLFRSFGSDPSAFGYEVSKLNGRYNGTTSDEVVTYYVAVPSKHVDAGIRLLARLLQGARFSNGDLKDERPVVLDELQRAESDPEQLFRHQVGRMLWGASWHRKDVGGDSGSIRGITLDRLKQTYARYYVPNNAALIVTGDVSPDRVFAAARRHFGEWKPGSDPFADRQIPPIAPRTSTNAVMLGQDVLDVTLVVTLHGPSVRADPAATYAADVLFDVFNDPGSPFQRRLVDGGAFHSVSGHYLTLGHTGPIEFRGKTTPERAQEALLTLLGEVDNLDVLEGVSDEDLAIAKKRRQVETALTLERTAMLAPQLAFWWSSAGMDYYMTYQDRMAAQTAADLRRFASAYIVSKPRVIGVLAAPPVVDQLAAWLRQSVRRSTP